MVFSRNLLRLFFYRRISLYLILFIFQFVNVAYSLAGSSLRDRFNDLFKKGKYKEAESLIENEGPSSVDPTTASKILKSLRNDFLNNEPIYFEVQNPKPKFESAKSAKFQIVNPTSFAINYDLKWGDGLWYPKQLPPFAEVVHSLDVKSNANEMTGSPEIRIKNPNDSEYSYFKVSDYNILETRKSSQIEIYAINYDTVSRIYTFSKRCVESHKYATVTIENETAGTIQFIYKWDRKNFDSTKQSWENNPFKSFELEPGKSKSFRFQYLDSNSNLSPNFVVSFYSDLEVKGEAKKYILKRNVSDYESSGKRYKFKMKLGSAFDLYSVE